MRAWIAFGVVLVACGAHKTATDPEPAPGPTVGEHEIELEVVSGEEIVELDEGSPHPPSPPIPPAEDPLDTCRGVHASANVGTTAENAATKEACRAACLKKLERPTIDSCKSHCGTHACDGSSKCTIAGNLHGHVNFSSVAHDGHIDCSCVTQKIDCPCGCLGLF